MTIDHGPAEQAIRPPAVGWRARLRLGGAGGFQPMAFPLGVAALAKRHGPDFWTYLKHLLRELPAGRRGPS